MNYCKIIPTLIFILLTHFHAQAFSPEKRLSDEAQENRARNLFLEVRCVVCGGQVIESSSTEFSFGMRELIRQKILEGKSDGEIKSDLRKEFGDDILTEVSGKKNFLLWLLPLILAFGGGFLCYLSLRTR